jgi:hypothetical protein
MSLLHAPDAVRNKLLLYLVAEWWWARRLRLGYCLEVRTRIEGAETGLSV